MLKGVDIQHDLVTCKYTWLEMACSIVREGGGGAGLGELEGRGGPGHHAGAGGVGGRGQPREVGGEALQLGLQPALLTTAARI